LTRNTVLYNLAFILLGNALRYLWQSFLTK
jgi:hypothetical protein